MSGGRSPARHLVNPACAGMIRAAYALSDARCCKPRVCGDDPLWEDAATRGLL